MHCECWPTNNLDKTIQSCFLVGKTIMYINSLKGELVFDASLSFKLKTRMSYSAALYGFIHKQYSTINKDTLVDYS